MSNPDYAQTATEYLEIIERANSGPLVLEINGIELVPTIASCEKTTLVLNEKGRLLLKRLLGDMTHAEYEYKSIVGRDAAWLDFLHEIL